MPGSRQLIPHYSHLGVNRSDLAELCPTRNQIYRFNFIQNTAIHEGGDLLLHLVQPSLGSMSDDYLYLPIQPASASLSSHLQALDLLAARLSSLQTRAEWETRVPLNSKASVKGRIVDTGNVKINIGGEWWVDMTPSEGEQWIRRRKTGMCYSPGSGVGLIGSVIGGTCESLGRLETWYGGRYIIK